MAARVWLCCAADLPAVTLLHDATAGAQSRRVDDLETRINEARAEASRVTAIAAERASQWQAAVAASDEYVVPPC